MATLGFLNGTILAFFFYLQVGFRINTILATFTLQDTLMFPTKFQINWPFGSGEEEQF